MNLQSAIPEALWDAVRANFQQQNYAGAINDAFYFLTELIRNKSDNVEDGASLIGRAFGGDNPPIKLTRLQTKSEKDVQTGTENILRGLYQSIRNPRSHKKITDTELDAETIIRFIGYLINKIDSVKTKFSEETFIEQIFDPHFVDDDNYARMLVDSIPSRMRYTIFLRVYDQKNRWNPKTIRHFFQAIRKQLPEHNDAIISMISDELQNADDDEIRLILSSRLFDNWNEVKEIARLRVENRLIKSILDGRYDQKKGRLISGGLGTFADSIVDHWTMKDRLKNAIYRMLSVHDNQQNDYVIHYFMYIIEKLDPKESHARLEKIFLSGLSRGNVSFYDLFSEPFPFWDRDEMSAKLIEAIEQFRPRTIDLDDEIPF